MATVFLSALISFVINFKSAAGDGTDVCGQTYLNETNGTIRSPYYPNLYMRNVTCIYTLEVPEGFSVYFRFIELETVRINGHLNFSCANGTQFDPLTVSEDSYLPALLIPSCTSVIVKFDIFNSLTTAWIQFRLSYSYVPDGTIIHGFKVKPSNAFLAMSEADAPTNTLNCTSSSDYLPWWARIGGKASQMEPVTDGFCNVSSAYSSVFVAESLGPGSCNLIAIAKAEILSEHAGIFICNPGTGKSAAALLATVDPEFRFSRQGGRALHSISDLEPVKDDEVNYSCSPMLTDRENLFDRSSRSTWNLHIQGDSWSFRAQFQIKRIYWTDETGREYASKVSYRSDVAVKAHVVSGVYVFPNYTCNIDLQFFSYIAVMDNSAPSVMTFSTGSVQTYFGPVKETMSIVGHENGKTIRGGTLFCHAQAHPTATYHWKVETIIEMVDGEGKITEEMVNGQTITVKQSGQYTCTASNIFRNKLHQESKTVTIQVIEGFKFYLMLVLISIPFVTMALTLFGFFVCKQWHHWDRVRKRNSVRRRVQSIEHVLALHRVARQESACRTPQHDDQRAKSYSQIL